MSAGGRLGGCALIAACALLASSAPASGSTGPLTLRRPSDLVRWSGQVANAVVPDPGMCAGSECPKRQLVVALGRRAWPRHGGGLLVTLHWDLAHFDLGYDLDVYVYGPDGRLAAKSATFAFAADEGAWVQDPANGTYSVVVVPRTVVGSMPYQIVAHFQRGYTVHEQAAYRLKARGFPDSSDLVMPGRRPRSARSLPPDLVAVRPTDFHMESAIGGHFYVTGSRGLHHQPSCLPQETTGLDNDDPTDGSRGALRCLRFDTRLDNRGPGPFELRSYQSDSNGAVYQSVYDSRGGHLERRVPRARFHVEHGRIHFAHFDDMTLHAIGPGGRPGRVVARRANTGTCKGDVQDPNLGGTPEGPPAYATPGTCDSYDWTDPTSRVHPGGPYLRTGIAPLWRDTAPWYLPDQYIDVSHVRDGRYLLVERINGDGAVREASRSNDTSVACVRIDGITATGCRLP